MRVLAFTVSHNRPYFLRHCVAQIAAQSYPQLRHSVSVTDDAVFQKAVSPDDYLRMLFSDVEPHRTQFSFHPNRHQHLNYLSAITSVADYCEYDLFIKIDDDDIYKRDYVGRCVDFHRRTKCDVSSTAATCQINGHRLLSGNYQNLGANPPGTSFCMPQSFAFNRAALEAITNVGLDACSDWEDKAWRSAWVEQGLIHKVRADESEFVWHIHGRNISVAGMLKSVAGPHPEKTPFRTFDCTHAEWTGTVFLYDDGTFSVTTNGDTGRWVFIENCLLELEWESWPKERLLFDAGRGIYTCGEKSFVAIDVTSGRSRGSQNQPQRCSVAGTAADAR